MSIDLDFQRRYATTVLELEQLNKDLNKVLHEVQQYCCEVSKNAHPVLVWLKGQLPIVELWGGSAVICEPGVICDSLLRWASLPQIREWFQLITLQSCAGAVRKRLSRWCRWALSQKMDSRVRQIPASRISSLGSQHCCCRSRYKRKEARLPSGLIPG